VKIFIKTEYSLEHQMIFESYNSNSIFEVINLKVSGTDKNAEKLLWEKRNVVYKNRLNKEKL
jgi:hypothetical protein